ncbi:MAG: ATP synthase subunit I [Cyclobacteriaceae bacterium]|nr:ATP synthase subunit I [Cyclobacteriaceae bacterium]
MNEFLIKFLVLMAGMAMGLVFFGGLWLTVKKTITSKRPALWYFLSMIGRTAFVLMGFYFISPGGWVNMLLSLVGFVLARFLVQHYVKTRDDKSVKIKNGI